MTLIVVTGPSTVTYSIFSFSFPAHRMAQAFAPCLQRLGQSSTSFVRCFLLPRLFAKGGASADARQLFAGKHIDDACAADARAHHDHARICLLYTSDAADEED